MSIYNLRPYIGDLPQVGGYSLSPYISKIPVPLELNAVAWYNFRDSSKLIGGAVPTIDVAGWKDSETSTSYDLSQGTASNQPTFTQPYGPVVFDGSDTLEDSTGNLTFNTNATFALRLKAGTQVVGSRILACKSSFNSSDGFHIAYTSASLTNSLRIRGSGATGYIQSITDTVVTSNLIITFQGTTCQVWQNASLQGSGTIESIVSGLNNFTIGSNSRNSEFFIGDMYEVICFDRVLNSTEIEQINTWMDR